MDEMNMDQIPVKVTQVEPQDSEPARGTCPCCAAPKEKKALCMGALLFAGAAAGFIFLTASGKVMRKMLRFPR